MDIKDINDEDIDRAIQKMKAQYAAAYNYSDDSRDGGSSGEPGNFDVCAYVETQMINEYDTDTKVDSDSVPQGTPQKAADTGTKSNKKQLFECSECTYVCKTRSALIKHSDTHFDIELYSADFKFNKGKIGKKTKGKSKKNVHCTLCSYRCTNERRLTDHMIVHSDEKPFSCSQCDFKTKHKLSLKLHTENKHDEKKKLDCPLCEFKCTSKPMMLKHMTKHLQEQTFTCIEPDCDFETKNVDAITEHIASHDIYQKSVMCPLCDFKGYTKDHMKAHMRTHKRKKTSVNKVFNCPYPNCDYRGAKQKNLKIHMMRHSGEKPHKCPHCDYRSVSKSKIHTHLTIHSDKKPHQCHMCDYKCALKDSLNKHIRTHTKPFKCSQCSFRAADRHYLNWHMMKHTGEKPFACDVCDFRCTSKTLLNSHVLVHSTEKPHACAYCPYATNRKQELTRHVERMHNEFKPAQRRPRGSRKPKNENNEIPHFCEYCPYATNRKPELTRHIERMHNEFKPVRRRPRQHKTQLNEIPPEAVLPQPGALGTVGGMHGMAMGMPAVMAQMPMSLGGSLGGYQPQGAHSMQFV